MTTFVNLRTAVARDIRDPGAKTFVDADVADLVNAALAEVGSIAPARFQEDITPVADTMEYDLRATEFPAGPVPEIEVVRVEVWDTAQTPNQDLYSIEPADGEYSNLSSVGWKVWDGVLSIPRWVVLDYAGHEADYLLRVWGYSPYPTLVADGDTVGLSNEREWALRAYCRVEALQRLVAERDLFTQWQTRSGNSDVSPAALMNGLNIAMEDWRRRSRKIAVLREAPGS